LASRGFAYLKQGRSEAAIADYNAEIKANGGNAYTLYGRGVGKRLTGDLAGSGADLAAATAINAGIAAAMAKLGVRL
jgi:hypothetical protein